MVRGKKIDGQELVPFMTKLEPGTKATMDALVKVQALDGNRVLINRMLQLYEENHPIAAEKAAEYNKLLGR